LICKPFEHSYLVGYFRRAALVSYLPNAQKTLLPESGHACLLETEVKLGDILQLQRFYGD
jgi:hypothetical protein